MSRSGHIAIGLFAAKPNGVSIGHFALPLPSAAMASAIRADVEDELFAACLTYSDAIRSLEAGNSSWAMVKLYYSAFYSMRSRLLLDNVVNFHSGRYLICDTQNGSVMSGGTSSHNWSWNSINSIRRLSSWIYSADSTKAYDMLRSFRELASYKGGFVDPLFPQYLYQVSTNGIAKSYRAYRDDAGYVFTFLNDHLSLAYPTRVLLSVLQDAKTAGIGFSSERADHIRRVWPLRDLAPLAA
jgi:hypothetical protein